MKVINLYGGPGIGKSTTAAELFAKLKRQGKKVEYVTEEAKEFTYEKRHFTLGCQPYIFGKQMRNIWRLQDQVDLIVTDSPINLSAIYARLGTWKWPDSFFTYINDQFNQFANINFLLSRSKSYQSFGRNQTEEEARQIDQDIESYLDGNNITYYKLGSHQDTVLDILTILGKLHVL